MKKTKIILYLGLCFIAWSCIVNQKKLGPYTDLQNHPAPPYSTDSLNIYQASTEENGDAAAGYRYFTEGNSFSSGIPLPIYKLVKSFGNISLARVAGYDPRRINDFVVFKSENGINTSTPGCLYCHAQRFGDSLIIGLGNSYSEFQKDTRPYLFFTNALIKVFYGKNSKENENARMAFKAGKLLAKSVITQVRGLTPAQKIAEIMASHRDPLSLVLREDTSYFQTPPILVPEDVPALWIVKKRKAFTVNAMRQGNFINHIATPTILTLRDSTEARQIYNNMKDVWAYLKTLEPPPYPHVIDQQLAGKGKAIYMTHCAGCHGNNDNDWDYPNKIIEPEIIGTDSLLWKYHIRYPQYEQWFNKSWFARTESPSRTNPQRGYVPPPLDGVWITAPYFHNGSVPTIEGVLNSKLRPRYWTRNFREEKYDYEKLGWKYKKQSNPVNKKSYNTDLPGYGNYGHYFGDRLNDAERTALLEYLKTL